MTCQYEWEEKFQSLIHQVSVSFKMRVFRSKEDYEKFQSLIHQVSVSFFTFLNKMYMNQYPEVSIPYSSGQCFFWYHYRSWQIRRGISFQSLIHQVSVSFPESVSSRVSDPDMFQSLIHQVSVSFMFIQWLESNAAKVSIPYSSGQCFFS